VPLSFRAIELSVFALAVVLFQHARGEGKRWVFTYLWAMVFGLIAEIAMVRSGGYTYGRFFLMVGPAQGQVPIWVGVGWGEVVYASAWTAQKMRMSWPLRPLAAGLLAVNVDLSLDPIADLEGYWHWNGVGPVSFFGVPFDNYLGWLLIVSVYALVARAGFRLFPPGHKGSDFWVSAVCAALALGLLVVLQRFSAPVYRALGGETVAFIVIFGAVCGVTFGFLVRSRRDHPPSWPILAVPLSVHGLLLVVLIATRDYLKAPALLVLIPLALLVGFFGFGWVSLETIFAKGKRPL
jgi:uncharacterized membrane protein